MGKRFRFILPLPLVSISLFGCAKDIKVPENDFHTQIQYRYLMDDNWRNIQNYAKGDQELSLPRALNLPLSVKEEGETYFVELAKEEAVFDSSKIEEVSAKSYELWNAELGQTYYYRAASSKSALAEAEVKSFAVSSLAPRNLFVEGMENFRDIGGWPSSLVPGARIRQGLYYRCANPDAITEKGKQAIKQLNIKVDIDLRDEQLIPEVSAASTSDHPVEIVNASIPSDTESVRYEGFADVYKRIFEKIADAKNNPVMLHCAVGADRTGIATFFLLALLGVSVEDCGRDYCWTNFASQGPRHPESEFDKWVEKTQTYYLDRTSFADQMKAHLMSKGISEDTLETIRETFVPGYKRAN